MRKTTLTNNHDDNNDYNEDNEAMKQCNMLTAARTDVVGHHYDNLTIGMRRRRLITHHSSVY